MGMTFTKVPPRSGTRRAEYRELLNIRPRPHCADPMVSPGRCLTSFHHGKQSRVDLSRGCVPADGARNRHITSPCRPACAASATTASSIGRSFWIMTMRSQLCHIYGRFTTVQSRHWCIVGRLDALADRHALSTALTYSAALFSRPGRQAVAADSLASAAGCRAAGQPSCTF